MHLRISWRSLAFTQLTGWVYSPWFVCSSLSGVMPLAFGPCPAVAQTRVAFCQCFDEFDKGLHLSLEWSTPNSFDLIRSLLCQKLYLEMENWLLLMVWCSSIMIMSPGSSFSVVFFPLWTSGWIRQVMKSDWEGEQNEEAPVSEHGSHCLLKSTYLWV